MVWDHYLSIWKTMKLGPYLILDTKNNSRWITNLSVNSKTLMDLDDTMGAALHDIRVEEAFINQGFRFKEHHPHLGGL